MNVALPHSKIFRILNAYGPVDGEFVAHKLGRGMAEVTRYLDAMEEEGIIARRGEVVGLANDSRWGRS